MKRTAQNSPIPNVAPARSLSQTHYWQEHINRWRESGLSQSAYCQREGLKLHCWYYWHKKLTQIPADKSRSRNDFIAVEVMSQARDQSLSVKLPNGIIIDGISTDNMALVGALLKHL